MKNLIKITAIVVALGFISTLSFGQETHTLTVTVKGITEAKGVIAATLTNDAENFPNVTSAVGQQKTEVTEKGELKLTFENVPTGTYAIILMQDLNGNDELDMNGQMPAEPFGFSKIAFLMGPPQFKDCAFEVKADTETIVSLISY